MSLTKQIGLILRMFSFRFFFYGKTR